MLATYKFVFNRKNIPLKGGETAVVQLRVTLNRRARYISTGIYIEKKQWAGRNGEWIVAHPQAPEYNAYLTEMVSRVGKADALANIDARSITYEAVKQLVRNDSDLFVIR